MSLNKHLRIVLALISPFLCICFSCGHKDLHEGSAEIAISRTLERAIEMGEKYVADRELIENVALTEGTDAACKLYDELHHRANYEAFWDYLEEADRIWRQIPDSTRRQEFVTHVMPYVNRLITLSEEIIQ